MNFLRHHILIILIAAMASIGIISYAVWGISSNQPLGGELVSRMTLTEEVNATGKIQAAQALDLTFEKGGKVTYVYAQAGDPIKKGQTLIALENNDLVVSLHQAERSLKNAQLALEKLKKPADNLSTIQAEDALAQAKQSKQKAEDDLKKAYEDGFNAAANAFLDLPTIMNGLKDMLFTSAFNLGQSNIYFWYDGARSVYDSDDKALSYRDDANNSYQMARAQYDKNFDDYKISSRYADNAALEALLNETYDTTKSIATAVKNANNLLDYYEDKVTEGGSKKIPDLVAPKEAIYQASLDSYTAKTNAHLLNLLAIQRIIQNSRDTVVNAEQAISEKEEALRKLKEGADELDIKSQEIRVKQAEDAMEGIQIQISKTIIRAPMNGIVAKQNLTAGENISPGVLAVSLISQSKFEINAYVSEADVAKIKIGDLAKVSLDAYGSEIIFDAHVTKIDPVETMVNGVASYGITFQFDNADERIKSGMTANINIETAKRENALAVPERVVIIKDNNKFVLVATDKSSPEEREIEMGIKGSNGYVEILSGLKEGDRLVNFSAAQ